MNKLYSVALFFLLNAPIGLSQQFTGIWEGHLDVAGTSLMVRFIVNQEGDHLESTMDIPLQGAKEIPSTDVVIDTNAITIAFRNLGIEYRGVISGDGVSISGHWIQAGQQFPLDLDKKEKETAMNRPQEPKPPFPYQEVEVTFLSAVDTGVHLAGTLTWPEGEGPFPGVVLITGSGPQNRDEEILGHKPFLLLADFFTKRGLAVLRYDDRGVAGSKGSFQNATTGDFAEDALGALQYLQEQDHVPLSAWGVLGHSEGGVIALMLAEKFEDLDFMILLAAPGRKGEDVIVQQNAFASQQIGSHDEEVERDSSFARSLFRLIPPPGEEMIDNEAIKELVTTYYEDNYSRLQEIYSSKEKFYFAQTRFVNDPWFRYYLHLDPAQYLDDVKCPVLALNGTLDKQVDAERDLGLLREGLKGSGHPENRFEAMTGLNHLFQKAETGNPGEYGTLEQTIDPKVLDLMDNWLDSLGY